MKIEPYNIAKEHIEKEFSPWGAIHPSSINDYPEVFEFSVTSKAFLEGTGNGPIGLGPTIISKKKWQNSSIWIWTILWPFRFLDKRRKI